MLFKTTVQQGICKASRQNDPQREVRTSQICSTKHHLGGALDPKTSVYLRVAFEGAKTFNVPRDAEKLLPAGSAEMTAPETVTP